MRIASLSLALAAVLLANACTRGDGREAPKPSNTSTTTVTETNKPASPAAEEPAPSGEMPSGEMTVEQAKAELPGFPVEEVPSYLLGPLVAAAKDEFVYDGSPYTLAGCLQQNQPCKENAKRGLTLIGQFLAAGASQADALKLYNQYYDSFKPENRKKIELSEAPCRGNEKAPVTLAEFSDFECPHCAAARPLLEGLVAQDQNVRLCFKNFPLPGHTNAMSAAQAAVFAQRYGKFWELHDLLFENQQRLSNDVIKDLVKQVGLDPNALVQAVQKDELAPVVEKSKAEGMALGIMGTPTIFVNGRQYNLPLNPELLRFTIQDELDWQAHGGKWAANP